MKDQRTNNLLAFAKGEEPLPPGIMAYLELEDNKIKLNGAQLLENGDRDLILKLSKTREDVEFWDTFDHTDYVNDLRKVLINDELTGKQSIKPVFPPDI